MRDIRSTADTIKKFRAGEAKEARVNRYPLRPFVLLLLLLLFLSFLGGLAFRNSLIENTEPFESGRQTNLSDNDVTRSKFECSEWYRTAFGFDLMVLTMLLLSGADARTAWFASERACQDFRIP